MAKQPNFKDDSKRRIFCASCRRHITDSHLGEKNTRNVRCRGCGAISIIYPPRKDEIEGQKVVLYGPKEGLYTADLTKSEIEDSI